MRNRKMGARFAIMRDLQDHTERGTLGLEELGAYYLIHVQADFEKGLWWGSAPKLHATAPKGRSLRDVQRILQHLNEIGFLKLFRRLGERGNYPVLINKYEPLIGAHKGQRLNATATIDWRNPVWEVCALADTVTDTLDDADAAPFQYSVLSNQHPEGKTRRQKPAPGDPRYQPFFDFAYKIFQVKHGGKAPTWAGKDHKQLKSLLQSNALAILPLDELKRRWENYVRSTDTFIVKQGCSLAYFCSKVDAFISGPLAEKGKPNAKDAIAQTVADSPLDENGRLKTAVLN